MIRLRQGYGVTGVRDAGFEPATCHRGDRSEKTYRELAEIGVSFPSSMFSTVGRIRS